MRRKMNMPDSNAPKVTVYMPNYNYGRFIRQAVDSVFAQTFDDFELIIIDDGSSDDSHEIIESYADNPKVITIYQQNKGLNVTNNIALRAARGEYIIRLDPDDWFEEHALQVLAGALDREPEAGLVFPDYYHVDSGGEIIEIVRRHNFDQVDLLDQPAHGACTMFRRNCLLEVEGYDESFQCQDGWDIWIRLVQHHKVLNVNLPLFYYRQHGSNLTRNEKRLLDTRAAIIAKQSALSRKPLEALAIIPVRGPAMEPGSISLEPLGDRLLIDWTVEAALNAEHVVQTVVSSPDDDILQHIANRYGDAVTGLKRSRKLARPNTYIEETLREVMSHEAVDSNRTEALAVLYTECPFRRSDSIDSAISAMLLFETDSVIGVRPEVDEYYRHNGSGLEAVRANPLLRLEREDLFRGVGQMYIVRRQFFEAQGKILGGKIGHVVLDQSSALYLRSDWDLRIARLHAAELAQKPAPKRARL